MYGTGRVVLTDVLSNCSLFLNSKIYIFINFSFDHECLLYRQDVGTKIVASARCKLAEHFRFHSLRKQEGTWPVQNKDVLPQVLHRSHFAGQNSSIKNMIFGDQGATTAEHALFLEYC